MRADTADLANFRITQTHQLDFNDYGNFPTKGKGLSKSAEEKILGVEAAKMAVSHEMLHASKSNGFLLGVQAMDAAGKDSVVKHGLRGLNVVGTRAVSFKAPTAAELNEEFLDRHTRALPHIGEFGVWVRSHYEEVAAVRVHPQFLKGRKGPSSPNGIDPQTADQSFWDGRLKEIRDWEKQRVKDSIPVVKVFLNASDRVRMERLLERTERPDKFWKVSTGDLAELNFMPQYRAAYQEAINATSTTACPWYVIPADDKQEAHVLLARIVNYELDRLKLDYPHFSGQALRDIDDMRIDLKKRLKKP